MVKSFINSNVKQRLRLLITGTIITRDNNSSGSYNLMQEQLSYLKENRYEVEGISGVLEMLNENAPISIQSGEFYFGKYGILINVGDEVGLVKAIQFLIDTPEKYQYYSQVGRLRELKDTIFITYKDFKMFLDPNN